MSVTSQVPGLQNFIERLQKIAEECGEKPKKEADPKDLFLCTKKRAYELLEQIRDDIHERQAILNKRGNCFETIERGHRIRQQLFELKASLPKLQELHKKAQKKRNSNAKREELQARYQDIRTLKRHTDDVNALFNSLSTGGEAGQELNSSPKAMLLGIREAARASEEDSKRLLSGEEQQVLDDIRKRDQQLDAQVGQLGEAVDRLDPLARQIGQTAERQRIKAEAMAEDASAADKDLREMNKKMKEVIQYQKNTNFCCQLILGITLLCCVGFVFQQLN